MTGSLGGGQVLTFHVDSSASGSRWPRYLEIQPLGGSQIYVHAFFVSLCMGRGAPEDMWEGTECLPPPAWDVGVEPAPAEVCIALV